MCVCARVSLPQSCCEEKALEGPILEGLAVTIWDIAFVSHMVYMYIDIDIYTYLYIFIHIYIYIHRTHIDIMYIYIYIKKKESIFSSLPISAHLTT